MMTVQAPGDRRTDGMFTHTGRVRVSCVLDSGEQVTVLLPDDWQTLLDRVAALESQVQAVPNSLEDLTYGG
jgi:phage baseplate assembly protein gpV